MLNAEEISGLGVVGKKLRIGIDESFEYTSFCPLLTDIGVIRRTLQMIYNDRFVF